MAPNAAIQDFLVDPLEAPEAIRPIAQILRLRHTPKGQTGQF